MHATAEKIVDLFKHLGTEDKKSIMVVFQPIFGRPLSEWNKATAEDKSRSLSDWAYLFMWRLAKSKEE